VIKTKRWNDPVLPDDGCRVLVCRYRPRGVRRDEERWDAWLPQLGPSKGLHAAVYGRNGPPIPWEEYVRRYLEEMQTQQFWIRALGERAERGETLTLLCSSACEDAARCHRTLLKSLLEEVGAKQAAPSPHLPGGGPPQCPSVVWRRLP
jgi:uncharacterized protein YeaO (DUF488 family)